MDVDNITFLWTNTALKNEYKYIKMDFLIKNFLIETRKKYQTIGG